jgi:pimeloyl-ACP methyl ester carboxylesterase
MAHRIAREGFPVAIIRLPFLGRHAPSESAKDEAIARAREHMRTNSSVLRWVVGGHSLGGAVAARFAARHSESIQALVLVGTTHPRDVNLSNARYAVTKVYGTRDGVAPLERMRLHAGNLPATTQWVEIPGGNHSQFGYYGPQLGDRRATITRAAQQTQLINAILHALRRTSARGIEIEGM